MTGFNRRRRRAAQGTIVLALALFGAPASAQDPAPAGFERMFGKYGFYVRCTEDQLQGNVCAQPPNRNAPTGFNSPAGVAWLDGERLLVADYGNLKLQVCVLDETLEEPCYWLGQDGLGGNDGAITRNLASTFDKPHGVEADDSGWFALADEDNHAVQYCNATGTCWYRGDDDSGANLPRSAIGFWAFPDDVAFDLNGDILGLDTANRRIQRLDKSSRALTVRALYQVPAATGPEESDGPSGLAVDSAGRFIISDTMNHRILVCAPPTSSVLDCASFGSRGSAPGQFEGPVGVDVDPFDRIWIADTGNHRIQVCDDRGACSAFGGFIDVIDGRNKDDPAIDWAAGPGLFNAPRDVAVHSSGRVAVTDTVNNRIQLFRTQAAVTVNAGMSDAWFNPATPGQGYFLSVFEPLDALFLAHFTFDRELPADGVTAAVGAPGHRWITAIGPVEGNTAVLDAEFTRGGVFDSLEPAPEQSSGYGTYRLEFDDCRSAVLYYDFPGQGLRGQHRIRRLVEDNVPLCEALQPAEE